MILNINFLFFNYLNIILSEFSLNVFLWEVSKIFLRNRDRFLSCYIPL